ncbi:MAG TPA: DUF4388 domain-containing protein [Kofleriaceae bacterium]|jgi:predicted regulator of Ras-like GTPase activity (Roadblock/LC7/MglB family)
MVNLFEHPSALADLLRETRGVIGVVLGTVGGMLSTVTGTVVDGVATSAAAAALTGELSAIGSVLGLGDLAVVSLKAPTNARVIAQQCGAVIAIELETNRPLGKLETELGTLTWAPEESVLERLSINRVPTVPLKERITGSTLPPPLQAVSQRPSPVSGGPGMLSPSPPSVPIPVPSVGSGPVFTGGLEELGLADLLEFLRNSQRTGRLTCTSPAGTGAIMLSRGMIISAASPNALDLRKYLLASPHVGSEARRELAALAAENFNDDAIDGVLVSRSLVPRDELERARVARIHSAFREMLGWKAGQFSFDPGAPVVANPAFALTVQSVLMRLYQEEDERSEFDWTP